MNAARLLLLAFLFGCLVNSAVMARNALFIGTGVVLKSGFLIHKPAEGVVTVVFDVINDKAVRLGYKAIFPDASEEKLALVLNDADVYRGKGGSRGEAKLLIHSGDHHRGDGLAGESGTWSEGDDGDNGFRVKFSRADGATLEILVSKKRHSPSTMVDMIPDLALTINVNDFLFSWEILSRLDFDALMRVNDTSAEALLEELFGSQGTE